MCNYCSLRQDCTFKSQEGICSAFITRIQFISSSHFFTWRDRSFLDLNFTIKTLPLLIKYQNAIMRRTEPKDLLSHLWPVFKSLCVCVCVWFLFLFCFVFCVERLHYIVVGDACISCGKPNSLLFCRSPPYLCLEQHVTLPYQKGIKVSSTFPFLIFRLKAVHRMYTPLLE